MIQTTLTGETMDIVSDNISKLKELFPDIVSEDKIDFDKLKLILGENVEVGNERYDFSWSGKSDAIHESQKQSTGTLRPCKEESKNWDSTENLYIEGDNLEVLKLLQKSYFGKIKAIYIDPPYNTGNDFIYSDNYKDNLENYLEITGQIDGVNSNVKLTTNTETSGRYHSNWLTMLYPRLKLARNLLKDVGVIFISIDDNEINNLRKICDEIFGEENFVAQFVWEQGRKSMAAQVAINHEYCLVYCKNKKENILNKSVNDWKIKKEGLFDIYKEYEKLKGLYNNDYCSIEKELKEFYNKLPNNHPAKKQKHFSKVDRNGIYNPDNMAQGTGKGKKFDIIHPITNKPCKIPGGGWRFSEKKVDELLDDDRIHFGEDHTSIPCIKRYLNETEYEVVSSVFYKDGRGASKRLDDFIGKNVFKFPKDENIIKMLISLVSNEKYGDIILDFFSGSGTTAESVMKLNDENDLKRKFILVQLPEKCDKKDFKNICEIGKERIRRAGDKILKESENKDLDIGFKVFKLDSSNLEKWDPDFNNVQESLFVDNIKEGRTKEDLIYEIMLKSGIDLTRPIEEINNFYIIGHGALVINLDDNITTEIADDLLNLKEKYNIIRVVFKDNGFKSDSDKTNIKETLSSNGIQEFITI